MVATLELDVECRGPNVPMVSKVAALELACKVGREDCVARDKLESPLKIKLESSIMGISPTLHNVAMKSLPNEGDGLGGETDSRASSASQFFGFLS